MRRVQPDTSGLEIYGTRLARTARPTSAAIIFDRTGAPDELLVETVELEYWHPRARGSSGSALRGDAQRRFRGHQLTCWNHTGCTIGSAQTYLNDNVVRRSTCE